MIYLDHNATTPAAPEVLAAMQPYLGENFGNPSSPHGFGFAARHAVEEARRRVADLLRADPEEIVFTSGGTEANNLALSGAAFAARSRGNRVVTCAVEHPSVLETARFLERQGFSVEILAVDHTGRIDPERIAKALTPRTVLVSIQHANNEVGTIQPVEEIAAICRKRRVLLHADAAQTVGKIDVSVAALGVDLLALSGHKFGGPKGSGALYARKGTPLESLLHGGDQERGRRAGTENVAAVVGLGAACALAGSGLESRAEAMRSLRDTLERTILTRGGAVRLNGNPFHRLPNTSSVSFQDVSSEALIRSLLPSLCVSAASACSTCNPDEWRSSHVLKAMAVPDEWSRGTLRLSVGARTTPEEAARAAELVIEAVARARSGAATG